MNTQTDTILREAAWTALEELIWWHEHDPDDEGTAKAVQALRRALGAEDDATEQDQPSLL